jgi:hypothetical protein
LPERIPDSNCESAVATLEEMLGKPVIDSFQNAFRASAGSARVAASSYQNVGDTSLSPMRVQQP